jgi:hypothetical protein
VTYVPLWLTSWEMASRGSPASESSETNQLPVVAVVLGALVLAQLITIQLAAGVAVVLAGVALTRRRIPVDRPTDARTGDPALTDQGPGSARQPARVLAALPAAPPASHLMVMVAGLAASPRWMPCGLQRPCDLTLQSALRLRGRPGPLC